MRRLLLYEFGVHIKTLNRLILRIKPIQLSKLLSNDVGIKLGFMMFNVEEKNVTEKVTRVFCAVALNEGV